MSRGSVIDTVARRVLHRARISKLTGILRDRLTLAYVKTQNGWQNMNLDALEYHLDRSLRGGGRRLASSDDAAMISTSSVSSRMFPQQFVSMPPFTKSKISRHQAESYHRKAKRLRSSSSYRSLHPSPGRHSNRPVEVTFSPSTCSGRNPVSSFSWQTKNVRLDLDPVAGRCDTAEHPKTLDAPSSLELSEDDDTDLSIDRLSTNARTMVVTSTLPDSAPSVELPQQKNVSWSPTVQGGTDEGELLLYLITTPSTNTEDAIKPTVVAPTTPPCKSTPLPSSHISPSHAFLGFDFNTPRSSYEFAPELWTHTALLVGPELSGMA